MGRYLPGYKDGGPVRSIKNLTDFLGEEYEFKILTSDRDHGDKKPYADIKVNGWNQVGKAKVYYVPPAGFSYKIIKTLTDEADLLYVCGCFNDYAIKILILNRIGLIKVPVVVAAMGLFSPMEFRLKYWKKKLFTVVFNLTGMFKNIYWSATSELEISEIRQQVQAVDNQFFVAEDLPRRISFEYIEKKKQKGELEVVWISRITPKKNLKGAVVILQKVKGIVHFTIYGPIHDEKYWRECQIELQKLPSNVTWSYKGNIESEVVIEVLKQYHVFLFPTLGENFGHVIQEALSAGCACILSDQTPWKNLNEIGVGAVYPIYAIEQYVETLNRYINMDEAEINVIANAAFKYAYEKCNEKEKETGYRKIFELEIR